MSTSTLPMSASAGPSSVIAPERFPQRWEGTISAPIEEDYALIFLHSFGPVIDKHHLPIRRHFHLILYLSLVSPLSTPSSTLALRLLTQILSLYPPTQLRSLIPHVPGPKAASDTYASAEGDHAELDKDVVRFMQKSAEKAGGIWGLLGEYRAIRRKKGELRVPRPVRRAGRGKGKRKVIQLPGEDVDMDNEDGDGQKRKGVEADEDEEEEEEGVEEEKKKEDYEDVVSVQGWRVLGLLVEYWKVDRKGHMKARPDQPWSPLFLLQLSGDRDPGIQINGANEPVRALTAGIQMACDPDVTAAEKLQVLGVCKGLMELILSAAIPPTAPLHPASLLISLLTLLRPIPAQNMSVAFSLIDCSSGIYAHLMALLLEDLAGVRMQKVAQRRNSAEVLKTEFRVGWAAGTGAENKAGMLGTSAPKAGVDEGGDVQMTDPPNAPSTSESASTPKPTTTLVTPALPPNFPPPTLTYISQLLLLSPRPLNAKGTLSPETVAQMRWLRHNLILWAAVHYGPSAGWGWVRGEGWKDAFKEVWEGGEEGAGREEREEVLGLIEGLIIDEDVDV